MPYQIKGKTVIKRNTGKMVGKSKNPKKYLNVLRMVEHGEMPKKKKKMPASMKKLMEGK